ncbi:MAG: uL14 family ribosomal protein, partial [Candidatus Aminicenantaceae bacterium]
MIRSETMLKVADNSGARRILCITPLGGGVGETASIGEIISATVKEAEADSKIPK